VKLTKNLILFSILIMLSTSAFSILPEFEVGDADPWSVCFTTCQKNKYACEDSCAKGISDELTAEEMREIYGPCSKGCLDSEAGCINSCNDWSSISQSERPSPDDYRNNELGIDDSIDTLEDSADSKDDSDTVPLNKEDSKETKDNSNKDSKNILEQISDLMNKNWNDKFSEWKNSLKEEYDKTKTEEIKKRKDNWNNLIDIYHDSKYHSLDLIDRSDIDNDINELEFMHNNRNHPELELSFDEANKLRSALGALYVQRARSKLKEAVEDLLTDEQAKRIFKTTKIEVSSTKDTGYDPDSDTIYLNTIWQSEKISDNAKIWRDVQENGDEDLLHEMSHVVFESLMDENSKYHSWDKSRLSRLRDWSAKVNPFDDYDIYRSGQNRLGGSHGLDDKAENKMFAFNEAGSHFTAYALASGDNKEKMLNTFKTKPTNSKSSDKDLYEKNVAYVLMELYNPKNGVILPQIKEGGAQLKDYFTTVESSLSGDSQIDLKEFIDKRRTMPGWNEDNWITLKIKLEAEERI